MQIIDINKATQPYEYYLKFIKENCRPDNRRLSDIRQFNVINDCISTVNGSSLVKLGSTTVICGISARLFKPKEDKPDRGCVICNVELPALSSFKNFMNQSASFSQSNVSSASIEQSQATLTQLLQDVLIESKCIDEKELCIKENKLAWVLYIDLICLNNDGNVQDACCLAMINTLKTLKLYEIDYDDNEDKPILKYPLSTRNLDLKCIPVCTTLFAIEENVLLSDPNKQEEDFMKTFIIICTTDKNQICLIRKFGGFCLNTEQLNLCLSRALENGNNLREKFFLN